MCVRVCACVFGTSAHEQPEALDFPVEGCDVRRAASLPVPGIQLAGTVQQNAHDTRVTALARLVQRETTRLPLHVRVCSSLQNSVPIEGRFGSQAKVPSPNVFQMCVRGSCVCNDLFVCS